MACSLPSVCYLTKPLHKHNMRKYTLQLITSQSFQDEGKARNIVDANLSILRERIEGLRMKERSNTGCKPYNNNGWSYYKSDDSGYIRDKKHKMHAMLSSSIEVVGLITTALALVFLTASLSILLVAFLVHFYA